MEQKIKQVDIGGNIRRIRLKKGYGQTELVRMLQLENIDMTRESLVKIERGIQHITGTQLHGFFCIFCPISFENLNRLFLSSTDQ